MLRNFGELLGGRDRLLVFIEELFDVFLAMDLGQRGIQRLPLVLEMRRRMRRHFLNPLACAFASLL